jgi:hypothetical protein
MMQFNSNRGATADLSKVYGSVSTRESSFSSLTKIVVIISIFLAILMVALM